MDKCYQAYQSTPVKDFFPQITKGYTNTKNFKPQKLLDKHSLELQNKSAPVELHKLTKKIILQTIASQRTNEHNIHFKKLRLQYNIDINELTPKYENIKRLSNSTKTRSFILKLYNGLLYGNHSLYRFGYRQTKACDSCEHDDQTMDHILLDCPKAHDLREHVYSKMQLSPSRLEGLTGLGTPAADFIIIHLNKFLHQCKYLEQTPHIASFTAMIKSEMKIEETIAMKNNKITLHLSKWEDIKQIYNI
jgi:hypothetical protein